MNHPTPSVGKRLEIVGLSYAFPSTTGPLEVLRGIDLAVARGRLVSIIGRSGCGKTTLFNLIAGLMQPTAGRVVLDGADVTGRAGLVAYMLQKDLLLPWRSIIDNVILGLELRGIPRRESYARARPLLARYGLGDFERARPAALSGGMRQRAALLRTVLCDRDVMLLDEPFGALDAQTRLDMQQWLLGVWRDFGRTIVLVTHDVDEAVFLSDEIHVLAPRPGRVIASLPVAMPRPRTPEMMTSPAFAGIKQSCMALLADNGAVA